MNMATVHRRTARKSTLLRPRSDIRNQGTTLATTSRLTARKSVRREPEVIVIPDSEEEDNESWSSENTTESDSDEVSVLQPSTSTPTRALTPAADSGSKGKAREIERIDGGSSGSTSDGFWDQPNIPVVNPRRSPSKKGPPSARKSSTKAQSRSPQNSRRVDHPFGTAEQANLLPTPLRPSDIEAEFTT